VLVDNKIADSDKEIDDLILSTAYSGSSLSIPLKGTNINMTEKQFL